MSYLNAIANSPYSYAYTPYWGPTVSGTSATDTGMGIEKTGSPNGMKGTEKTSSECKTCSERKYQDGSDEMVSFKNATHISPEQAGTAVRAHEQEHVRNAYAKAAQGNGKVLSASVAIHTARCPECGRTYVSGGLTTTKIQYSDESNPYQKNQKSLDQANIVGMNVDYAV